MDSDGSTSFVSRRHTLEYAVFCAVSARVFGYCFAWRGRSIPVALPGLALLGLALLGGSAVVAGDFTPNGTQEVLNQMLNPLECMSGCHNAYDEDHHIEPWDTWAGSMMANAARDPVFWAALDVANNDVPGIGEFCLRCHAPVAWLNGRANAGSDPDLVGDADGCGLIGPIDTDEADFSGLTCHLCHRMTVNDNPPAGQETVYFENGDFWIDDDVCEGYFEPCRRGPYDYPSLPEAPHAWAHSDYHVSNDICGNCHNVTNPLEDLLDSEGASTGVKFPIERTFKEWQSSDYSQVAGMDFQSCSSCHMPDADADPVYASGMMLVNRTGDLPIHQFAGGNTWIPRLLKGEYPTLGSQRGGEFDATVSLAMDMLQNRSALVEVSVPATAVGGSDLEVGVKVTNLSGHKLPTGYGEGRRMWLHVVARDGKGAQIWESAAYDGGSGVLTIDAQAKVYEVQQGIWDYNGTGQCDVVDDGTGKHLFHFVRNNCVALDNRIPPLGFTGGADPEVQPVQYTYPDTSPGSGILVHWDVTSYGIPIPSETVGPVTVEAALFYQTSSKEYIEFLRDQVANIPSGAEYETECIVSSAAHDPPQARGDYLYSVWNSQTGDLANSKSPPVEMGSDSESVPVLPELIFVDGFESGDTSSWS